MKEFIKKYLPQVITLAISLLVFIILFFIPKDATAMVGTYLETLKGYELIKVETPVYGVTTSLIFYYLIPIISFQFWLFSFQIIKNETNKKKWFSLFLIPVGILFFAIMSQHVTTEDRFFVNIIGQFIPLVMDDGSMLPSIVMPFMPIFDFERIRQTAIDGESWSHLYVFMNATLIYGIIAYFAIPKKLLKRYGNARYFVSLFISPILTLILLVALLCLALLIMEKFLGGSSSSSASTTSTNNVSNNDTRLYKSSPLDLESEGRFDDEDLPHYFIGGSGKEYSVYNYHKNTGYFEDENGNIYYKTMNNEFVKTGLHREYGESEYEADERAKKIL
mgnify:FL=1